MAATILTGASFLPCCSFKLGIGSLQTDKKALLLNRQWHYKLVRNHMEKQGTTCITRAVAEVEPETSDAVSYDPNESMLMLFKAEGTVPDASIPDVTKALKDLEGVENVEVASNEAMTTISAVKRTTIQATSVASEMVEAIEKSGFHLHTLHLGVDDSVPA